MVYVELLQEIGLSLNEARVYETLLPLGNANVQTIANKSGVHRRNVYDSLAKLIEKGLASETVLEGERTFSATDPKLLMTMLHEKEDLLEDALPELQKRFAKHDEEEQAYIYRGIQGWRNYMQDILDVGEDFYSIGAKGGWFDPRLKAFRSRFYKEFNNKKLKGWHLFDQEMREHIGKEVESPVKHHLQEARFLPASASTLSAIDIFGDRIVTFTGLNVNELTDDIVLFVIKSRKLADAYRKWFKFMWENCEE